MLVVQDISLVARKRVGLHGQRNEINSWLRQEGSLPQSAVVRITYRDIGSPAKKPNFLATQRQLTYLVAPASGLRRLYFVVLRLMYERRELLSHRLWEAPFVISHSQGLLF